jgi:hypothetical protein
LAEKQENAWRVVDIEWASKFLVNVFSVY